MLKYWRVFTTVFSYHSAYRGEVIANLATGFLTPLFLLAALSQALPHGPPASQLLPYYLLISLTYPIFKSDIEVEIGQLTASGNIALLLTKPVRLYHYLLFKQASYKLTTLLFVSPFILLYLLGSPVPLSRLITSILALTVSFLISFNLSYLAGLATFWLEEIWVAHNLKDVFISLLGGIILPLSLFPSSLAKFLRFTPFPYAGSLLAQNLLSRSLTLDFALGIAWSLLLFIPIYFLEKRAINKYSYVAH